MMDGKICMVEDVDILTWANEWSDAMFTHQDLAALRQINVDKGCC